MTLTEILVIYLISGMVGVFSHYTKKWLNGEIDGSLFCYLFIQHPKKTGLTVFTFLGTAGGYVLTNSFEGMSLTALIGLGFGMGYAADSATNKGETAEFVEPTK